MSYWDLYLDYLRKCETLYKQCDIDPHHYDMEWNHTLPKCVFGDHPIGCYLLLKHHAIASGLQTLALRKNCLCGWHFKYLPKNLLTLCVPFYQVSAKNNGSISGQYTKNNQLGIHAPGAKSSETCSLGGRIGGKKAAENQSGMFVPGVVTSETRSKGGKTGCKNTNSQKWICLNSGYISTPAGLTKYQTTRGIDTTQRKRVV